MKVYTTGTFDILHDGHINLFRKCRRIAGDRGRVIVGVSTDEAYRKHKGTYPIMNYKQRSELVESIMFVDEVRKHNQENMAAQIKEIKPDILVKGTDWIGKSLDVFYHLSPEELDELIVYVPYTQKVSSTLIKRKICELK